MCPRSTVVHRFFSTVLAVGLLMLAACANAPQILPIQPQVAGSRSSGSAAERSLSVKVIDARENEIVGYRNPQVAASVLVVAQSVVPVPCLSRKRRCRAEPVSTRVGARAPSL